MDFKTFKEEVKENVRAHLPKEAKDVELSFGTYQKMNYSYEALFINIPEKNAQVSINLDELYEAYKDGQDLSKFYEIIPEIVESKEVDRAKEISFDYEQVKPHLFIRVDRVEGNENILENVPHCQMEDLALTYHVLLNKDGEGISKAMITNSWLEILGVTQEQLHQDALNKNTFCLHDTVQDNGSLCSNLQFDPVGYFFGRINYQSVLKWYRIHVATVLRNQIDSLEEKLMFPPFVADY